MYKYFRGMCGDGRSVGFMFHAIPVRPILRTHYTQGVLGPLHKPTIQRMLESSICESSNRWKSSRFRLSCCLAFCFSGFCMPLGFAWPHPCVAGGDATAPTNGPGAAAAGTDSGQGHLLLGTAMESNLSKHLQHQFISALHEGPW